MKLYAFQPIGHGPSSFFVIAESEEKARQYIENYIKVEYSDEDGELLYMAEEWKTTRYKMTVLEPGQIIENENS